MSVLNGYPIAVTLTLLMSAKTLKRKFTDREGRAPTPDDTGALKAAAEKLHPSLEPKLVTALVELILHPDT